MFIVGAGLPRTGTNSLQVALKILLGGPVYHMWEVVFSGTRDVEFWNEASQEEKTADEWKDFFSANGYKGGVDFPCVVFYKLVYIFFIIGKKFKGFRVSDLLHSKF